MIHAFGQRINKHRRRRRFEIIALAVALIHHLPPQAAAGVLPFHDAGGKLFEVAREVCRARADDLSAENPTCPRTPSHTSRRRGPRKLDDAPVAGFAHVLDFGRVPAVIKQSALRIVKMLVNQMKLFRHVIKILRRVRNVSRIRRRTARPCRGRRATFDLCNAACARSRRRSCAAACRAAGGAAGHNPRSVYPW